MPADASQIRIVFDAVRLIVHDLREASRATEARFGIGAAQLFVLQILRDAPALSVNELAARTYTHQSSVSAVLKKLHQRQLVTARPSPRDARRLELSLTARGRKVTALAPDAMQMRLIAALDGMPAIERGRLARGCLSLVRAMGGHERKAAMFPEQHDGMAINRKIRQRSRR